MNVVDLSAWIKYFTAGHNATVFAEPIEATRDHPGHRPDKPPFRPILTKTPNLRQCQNIVLTNGQCFFISLP